MNRLPPYFAQFPRAYALAEAEQPSRIWLPIVTDFVLLFPAFLMVLFSISNVKINELKNIINLPSKTHRPTPKASLEIQNTTFNNGTVFRSEAANLDYLTSIIKENVENIELLSETRLSSLEDLLGIHLQSDQLFET